MGLKFSYTQFAIVYHFKKTTQKRSLLGQFGFARSCQPAHMIFFSFVAKVIKIKLVCSVILVLNKWSAELFKQIIPMIPVRCTLRCLPWGFTYSGKNNTGQSSTMSSYLWCIHNETAVHGAVGVQWMQTFQGLCCDGTGYCISKAIHCLFNSCI